MSNECSCVQGLWSPSICIFSCGSTQSFLWFRGGLTQVNHPGNVLLLQRLSVPFTLNNTQVPGTKFLPTISLHNPVHNLQPSLGQKLFELKGYKLFLAISMPFPDQWQLCVFECFRKGFKAAWYNLKEIIIIISYFLILASQCRKQKVTALGLTLVEFTLLKKCCESMSGRCFLLKKLYLLLVAFT